MAPIVRCLLFSGLCAMLWPSLAHAQATQVSAAPGADLLTTSAIPSSNYPDVSDFGRWTQRGPADYIGAEIGLVGLVRQKPNGQVIATNQDDDVILNADELQGDMQFGLATKLDIYQVSNAFNGTDLQLGYWGINSMDATRTLTANQVKTNFFQGTTAGPPIQRFNYIYSSNLYSGEANLRLNNIQRLRPLVGMRYLKLEDTFDQFEFISNGTSGFYSLTNNSLFGAQLGLEATVLRYRSWDWFAIGKYGAMHNRVEGSAMAALGGGDAVKNYDGSNFCSLVDGQTGVVFRFVDQLQFRIAYQALYCSDIASGIDQSEAIAFVGTPDQVVFDSRFWQGVSLSATFSF